MMVIQGRPGAATVAHIFPADKCSWAQDDSASGNGYSISDAVFYPGFNGTVTGQALGTGQAGIAINDAVLGYIGKSGRFVAISN